MLAEAPLSRRYGGTKYDVGQWTSAWTSPGFGLTELIGSWQATTPRNSWVEIRVRGRAGEHQVDGARRAVGHAYGGGSQFFAMWVVGSDKP